MKNNIDVFADNRPSGTLLFNEDDNEYLYNYKADNFISLTMPYREKTYISRHHLHPVFDMNMPEGYLYELLKKYLQKELKELNDFTLFNFLSKNINSRLTYAANDTLEKNIGSFSLEDILENRNENLFFDLIEKFLYKSAVSGVQPKLLTTLTDKLSLSSKEYIVKTFGEEYPNLAENEYFCMKAIQYAGLNTPNFYLSKNRKLFIVERFDYLQETDTFLGFEDMCVLLKQNKEQKYKGSYEKIVKIIEKVSTRKFEDLKDFFKLTVMNFLLKNGDAHLKNFGILYTSDLQMRTLSPVYDVVNTVVYIKQDKPALTMFSKNIWYGKKKLLDFGVKNCYITKKEAEEIYAESIEAVQKVVADIETYIQKNKSFKRVGEKMVNYFNFSIKQEDDHKEITDGL